MKFQLFINDMSGYNNNILTKNGGIWPILFTKWISEYSISPSEITLQQSLFKKNLKSRV